jgi:hypothetical protein
LKDSSIILYNTNSITFANNTINASLTLWISPISAYISIPVKNLIIHPEDPTTNFLSPIYAPVTDMTVIKGGITKAELKKMIDIHDRISCSGMVLHID